MQKSTINILYLDDEGENLNAFKATFRRHYTIFTTTSPKQAVEILSKEEIHLLIVDQRMPNISGVDFLMLMNEEFPLISKILITGLTEIGDSLEKAIAEANIFRFIHKPWTEGEIRVAIEDAFRIHMFKVEKCNELFNLKSQLITLLSTPIANLEGLINLARFDIKDENALNDYFDYMNSSVESIKFKLSQIIEPDLVE
jgi:response regulator RpfG family c-di-GMP phosphodiesterase